jgi:succinate dehydrogenase/fumarate reductase flavoprotein subunit
MDDILDFQAKAVVLATGGYEGNHEMMIKYVGPEVTYGTVLTGCPTNTGDGHLMALDIGAQLANLSVCHIRVTDEFFDIGPTRHLRHLHHLGIYINQNCRRFIDEGVMDSDNIANAIVYQPANRAALIFDEKARAMYPEEYETYPRKEKVIKTAGTIEELAKKIDMPPEKLKGLVEQFNHAVEEGKAPDLPIPKAAHAHKIDTPPFYGFYPVITGLNHPLGGLKINSKAQVLDKENDPISRRYAAGSIVNWAFGKPYEVDGVTTYLGSYHAGSSSGLATALVFGRIAGKNASAEALRSKAE